MEEEYNFLEGEYNQYQGRQEECRSDQQNARLLLSPEILDLRFCEGGNQAKRRTLLWQRKVWKAALLTMHTYEFTI